MLPAVDAHARERWHGRCRVVEPHRQTATARGFDPVTQTAAMEREGVDLMALFLAISLYVMGMISIPNGKDHGFDSTPSRKYMRWVGRDEAVDHGGNLQTP